MMLRLVLWLSKFVKPVELYVVRDDHGRWIITTPDERTAETYLQNIGSRFTVTKFICVADTVTQYEPTG